MENRKQRKGEKGGGVKLKHGKKTKDGKKKLPRKKEEQ
jgi:hypothetical protein